MNYSISIQKLLETLKKPFGKKATSSKSHTHITINTATEKYVRPPFIRFSVKERVLFAKRLSFLVRAGVSLLESMVMIRNQTKSKPKQKIYDNIIADISAGQFLSKSLEQYVDLFGEFTVNLIKVGESAGILAENLIYLADELAKKQALQRKVYGALVYPVFITIATLGVTGMLIVFIFPKIMPIFVSLNIELPATTRFLLSVSQYLEAWGLVTIGGVLVFIFLFFLARKFIMHVRRATDWFMLQLPIVGSIARSYNAANFCRTLSLTIRSGIVTSEALHITADVTKNVVYKEMYLDIAQHVMRGEQMSKTLVKYPSIFPDMLPHMIHIGESTGTLTDTLGYLAELYETEVDESTKNLSSSIEPILLMMMGIFVGLIAVSVISPIYEVTRHLSNTR